MPFPQPRAVAPPARGLTSHGGLWLTVYLFFVLAPLFALLLGATPPARSFWTEFSIAIGYSGLAMMGLQFGLTARFQYVTEPWGEDVIYHFHRQISLIAVALVVAHPIAGGVGITPMMSIIRTLADQGDKRPVVLLYGSKDRDAITFREEL